MNSDPYVCTASPLPAEYLPSPFDYCLHSAEQTDLMSLGTCNIFLRLLQSESSISELWFESKNFVQSLRKSSAHFYTQSPKDFSTLLGTPKPWMSNCEWGWEEFKTQWHLPFSRKYLKIHTQLTELSPSTIYKKTTLFPALREESEANFVCIDISSSLKKIFGERAVTQS